MKINNHKTSHHEGVGVVGFRKRKQNNIGAQFPKSQKKLPLDNFNNPYYNFYIESFDSEEELDFIESNLYDFE